MIIDVNDASFFSMFFLALLLSLFWPILVLYSLFLLIVSVATLNVYGISLMTAYVVSFLLAYIVERVLLRPYFDKPSELIEEAHGVPTPIDQTLSDLFKSGLKAAIKDVYLTTAEVEMIKQIEFHPFNFEKRLNQAVKSNKIRGILLKILENITLSPIRERELNQVLVELKESGWDLHRWINNGIWFVFKVVIFLDETSNLGDILNSFDHKLCDPRIKPTTGLCLGTKHYVIKDINVSLLGYALDPANDSAWVREGAYEYISFDNQQSFQKKLGEVAHKLLDQNYVKKLQVIEE
jgi:hypothetical protein